jgi:hypothetical protein
MVKMRPAGYLLAGLRDFICTLPPNPVIVEIGSYAGESAAEFLRVAKLLICVDIWTPYRERNGVYVDGITDPKEAEEAFDDLARNNPGRIIKLKMPSTAAALLVPLWSADVIYIDGNHEQDFVAADIAAWLPKVRRPGIIAGHDYSHMHFTGVKPAVDAAFPNGVHLFADTTWAVNVA